MSILVEGGFSPELEWEDADGRKFVSWSRLNGVLDEDAAFIRLAVDESLESVAEKRGWRLLKSPNQEA